VIQKQLWLIANLSDPRNDPCRYSRDADCAERVKVGHWQETDAQLVVVQFSAFCADVNVGGKRPPKGRIVMNICSASHLLLTGTIAALSIVVWPAAAQQPSASPEAPPPWAQGRPETAIGANLAPIVPPPLPTTADKLPIAKLKAPKGFKIEVYASGLANARSLRQGDQGTVFVSSRILDKVYAVTDQAGRHEVKTLYSGLYRPNGLAFANGTLYIAELAKISKVEKIEDNLDNPPKPVVIYDDLPKDEAHGWKFLTLGPDNKLYFNVGAGRSCDEFTKPVTLLGPHSAPLGMRFYTGNMFPPEYRNAIFVARHGSWNRSKKFGGDIVVVSLNDNGTVKSIDPFITGFIENNNYLGRPADLMVLKDGSMLISDDYNGAVYRVTYDGASVAR
jgi:glucose/arabinose dehydrogenase